MAGKKKVEEVVVVPEVETHESKTTVNLEVDPNDPRVDRTPDREPLKSLDEE